MRLSARRKAATRETPRRGRTQRRRDVLIAAGVGIVAGLVAIGWAEWQMNLVSRARDSAADTMMLLSGRLGFTVQQVLVDGRRLTPPDALRAALAVETGTPIFGIDLAATRGRLEALGWVQRASIARRLPDTLYVRIEEREPMALWQHHGQLALVSLDGEVIVDRRLERFASLPLVVGEDAAVHAAGLLRALAREPALAARLKSAVRVSQRRWDLQLANGVLVKLPAQGTEAALARLARIDADSGLLDRAVAAVDLRVADRMYVQLRDADQQLADNPR
jgi:cell division protein FtsQ